MSEVGLYKLVGTSKTPDVELNVKLGHLTLQGRAIPDDAYLFFAELDKALERYLNSPCEETIVTVRFEYFNTSTSKWLLDMFRKLEQVHQKASVVTVKWFYDQDDEDMEESGQDFQAIIDLPFEILPMTDVE